MSDLLKCALDLQHELLATQAQLAAAAKEIDDLTAELGLCCNRVKELEYAAAKDNNHSDNRDSHDRPT